MRSISALAKDPMIAKLVCALVLFVSVSLQAQPAESVAYRLSIEPVLGRPTFVKVSLTNLGIATAYLGVGDPGVLFKFHVSSKDGAEPPRTPAGEHLRIHGSFEGRYRFDTLPPGATSSQEVDLRWLWALTQGTFTVLVDRFLPVDGKPVAFSASTTLTIPPDFVWEQGCTPDAKAAREPNRQRAKLKRERTDRIALELEQVLKRPVRYIATETDNDFVKAFVNLIIQTYIPGGLAMREASKRSLACLDVAVTVQDGLESIRASNPLLELDWRSPVLNLLEPGLTDFLETKIATLQIRSPIGQGFNAVRSIFESPEMKQRATVLKMEYPPSLPSGSASASGVFEEDPTLRLENVTAREALNAVMTRWGGGAWIYAEARNGDGWRFTLESYLKHRR